jgi:hypothetical protein
LVKSQEIGLPILLTNVTKIAVTMALEYGGELTQSVGFTQMRGQRRPQRRRDDNLAKGQDCSVDGFFIGGGHIATVANAVA